MNPLQGSSEIRHGCSLPPYNAQNFNSASASVYNILQVAAYTQPSYPLPPGADARQITLQTANVSYFNTLNLKVQAAVTANVSGAPFPSFRTERERLMYVQGGLIVSFCGTRLGVESGEVTKFGNGFF